METPNTSQVPAGAAETEASAVSEAGPAKTGHDATRPQRMNWQEVAVWRKAERERLIAARLALSPAIRTRHAERIIASLRAIIGYPDGAVISFYWPMKGEPDLRPLMHALHGAGAICALPVVLERGQPLSFRAWAPDAPMERGVWNIPIPARAEYVTPHLLVAPVVGFDPQNYRLGYGGGYFDRTLAWIGSEARAIGVGYEQALLSTIRPQRHDIRLTGVVTEQQVHTGA
jgi:5,10-methenyltetrahydrofolate synthetase